MAEKNEVMNLDAMLQDFSQLDPNIQERITLAGKTFQEIPVARYLDAWVMISLGEGRCPRCRGRMSNSWSGALLCRVCDAGIVRVDRKRGFSRNLTNWVPKLPSPPSPAWGSNGEIWMVGRRGLQWAPATLYFQWYRSRVIGDPKRGVLQGFILASQGLGVENNAVMQVRNGWMFLDQGQLPNRQIAASQGRVWEGLEQSYGFPKEYWPLVWKEYWEGMAEALAWPLGRERWVGDVTQQVFQELNPFLPPKPRMDWEQAIQEGLRGWSSARKLLEKRGLVNGKR